MKKNIILYVLLIFLVIVNGFFLYNSIGQPDARGENGRQDPMSFIVKQLNFDDVQLEKMDLINEKHHSKMKRISDDLRDLKDSLFTKLSDKELNDETVDSITSLIGEKQKEREKEVFYHFKSIQDICSEKQIKKFETIIKDALRKGDDDGQMSRRPEGPNGERPPNREGHQPPPRN